MKQSSQAKNIDCSWKIKKSEEASLISVHSFAQTNCGLLSSFLVLLNLQSTYLV